MEVLLFIFFLLFLPCMIRLAQFSRSCVLSDAWFRLRMDTYEELLFAELDFCSDVDMEQELLDELMKLEENEVDGENNRVYRHWSRGSWFSLSKRGFDEVFFNELDCLNANADGGIFFKDKNDSADKGSWGSPEHLAQGVKRLAEKVTRNWRGTEKGREGTR